MAYIRHMRNLITTRKAADELGISSRQVLRLVHEGDLSPAAKLEGLRGAFLFEPEELARVKADRA